MIIVFIFGLLIFLFITMALLEVKTSLTTSLIIALILTLFIVFLFFLLSNFRLSKVF